ncbi:hypothetical protein [Actinocorallia longicatena]
MDEELEAIDIARRVGATDCGELTLGHVEAIFDDLAVSYHRSDPGELLVRIMTQLKYISRLLDGRKTFKEHRRLLVTGGWLSLLAATCHIDLDRKGPAAAFLRTARSLAEEAEHDEIIGWCLETQAWQHLTEGDYVRAVALSQAAQHVAPKDSSAYIQASAQEGRAWARMGDRGRTRALVDRVTGLAAALPATERPEHHYRYDPAKSDAYIATTLAWLGDVEAAPIARQVLARLIAPSDGTPRLRRAASARLDLSLALIAGDEPDEAAHETMTALASGVLVPSNYWRAQEVISKVEARGLPEAHALNEAYQGLRRSAPRELS